MKPSSEAISPLRQRMIEDMRMRKLELKTRTAYLRAVKKLAAFLKRSPHAFSIVPTELRARYTAHPARLA
jgi:integrase/recombinase XerD